ncbi:MAG: hypothetical protein KF862_14980 [Chitinophagaceae bacterium]|nr:hypothetical protein [Chitinophagaceae bacterium]
MNNPVEILYHDIRYDDVVFLTNSHQVGIGFRKIMLMLDTNSFGSFLLQVRYTGENTHVWDDPNVQSLMIDTPCSNLSLLLTREELNRLYKMLEAANEYLRTMPGWLTPAGNNSCHGKKNRITPHETAAINAALN